ncbi:MAG: NfeD family protein [Myxococcota bacterium]|jgi:membrane protein implicated in regulation of membrane protease activity
MRSDRRVLIRYTLFQIPDLILLGLALAIAVQWWDIPSALAYTLFGLWLLKDILLFPVMRVAYAQGGPANDRLTGALGIAREALDPTGYVMVGSELWRAELAVGAESVSAGTEVRVVKIQGLTLLVEPVEMPNG